MKATITAVTGTNTGTWVAFCHAHALRYERYYPKHLGGAVRDYAGDLPECRACEIARDNQQRYPGGYIDDTAVARINKDRGGHFFDADTMGRFRSRTPDAGRFLPGDWLSIAIITSEKRTGFMTPDGPRTYTVRILDCVTGYLEEDPRGFEGYSTLNAARKGLERVLVAGRVQVAA